MTGALEPGAPGDTLAARRARGAPEPLPCADLAAPRTIVPRKGTVSADAAGESRFEREPAPWSVVLLRQAGDG